MRTGVLYAPQPGEGEEEEKGGGGGGNVEEDGGEVGGWRIGGARWITIIYESPA